MIFSTISQDLYNKKVPSLADYDIKNLPDFSIRVLRILIQKQISSAKVFYSHETMALLARCSVSSVRRALYLLRSQGLLQWQQRLNKSCLYFVNRVLLIKSNLQQLEQFFTTYFRCILPQPLRSPKKSPESSLPENEQLSKFKGIFSMIISHLSNRVKEVNPDDPFGDRTKEPPVLKKTEQRQESDSDYPLRDTIIGLVEKSLPLTEHGKLKLRQYPSSALQTAKKDINIALKRENPFIHLLWICEQHCKENGLYVERSRYNQQCYKKGINTQDNNFYNKDAFEQSKMNNRGRPDAARSEPTQRPSSYFVWRPDDYRMKQDVPKDFSFLEQVGIENSTQQRFIDILLKKVRVA